MQTHSQAAVAGVLGMALRSCDSKTSGYHRTSEEFELVTVWPRSVQGGKNESDPKF